MNSIVKLSRNCNDASLSFCYRPNFEEGKLLSYRRRTTFMLPTAYDCRILLKSEDEMLCEFASPYDENVVSQHNYFVGFGVHEGTDTGLTVTDYEWRGGGTFSLALSDPAVGYVRSDEFALRPTNETTNGVTLLYTLLTVPKGPHPVLIDDEPVYLVNQTTQSVVPIVYCKDGSTIVVVKDDAVIDQSTRFAVSTRERLEYVTATNPIDYTYQVGVLSTNAGVSLFSDSDIVTGTTTAEKVGLDRRFPITVFKNVSRWQQQIEIELYIPVTHRFAVLPTKLTTNNHLVFVLVDASALTTHHLYKTVLAFGEEIKAIGITELYVDMTNEPIKNPQTGVYLYDHEEYFILMHLKIE